MIGSIITGLSSLGSMSYQNKQNRELLDEQNAASLRNWNRQNAYNSPSAQMARLKAAGLNPNLIYQNGGAFTGADAVQSVSPDFAKAPDYSAAISHGIDAYNAQLQADSVQAQIDYYSELTAGQREDNYTKLLNNENLPEKLREDLANLVADTAFKNSQADLAAQQKDYYKSLTGLTDQQIINASQEWSLMQSHIDEMNSRNLLNSKQAEQLSHLITQIDAETDLITKQIEQAVFVNWLNSIEKESFKYGNRFELSLDILYEQLDDLQWRNSDQYREMDYARGTKTQYLKGFDYSRRHKRSKRGIINPYNY